MEPVLIRRQRWSNQGTDSREISLKIYIQFSIVPNHLRRCIFLLFLTRIFFFLFSSFFSCSIYNFTRLSNASCAKAGITGSFGNSRRGLKRIPNRWRLDPTAVTRYSLRLYLRDYLHEQTRTSAWVSHYRECAV